MSVQERNFKFINSNLPPPERSENSSQLPMQKLLDQTVKKKDKEDKLPLGYIRMSPSDLKRINLGVTPCLNEDLFDVKKMAPSLNKIISSMRGTQGHFIYELYIQLARIYRTRLIGTLSIADIQKDLTRSNWSLKPEEKIVVHNSLQSLLENKVFRENQTIQRKDFARIIRPVWSDWRNAHAFYNRRVDRVTKRKRTYKYIDGEVHKASVVKKLWNDQVGYGEKVIRALTDKVYFPQESVPATSAVIECTKIANTEFPGGQLIQFSCIPDFICYPDSVNYAPGEPSGIIIFDSKFGKPWEEDTQVMRDERMLYQAIVWESFLKKNNVVNISNFHDLHPEKVDFCYSVINLEEVPPSIDLLSGYQTKEELEIAMTDIEERVEHWSVFQPYHKFRKDQEDLAVVMPHIPDTPIGNSAQLAYI